MPTISEILKSVAPNAKPNYVDGFTNAQDLLFQFGINTPLRISHFLAQVLHETGGGMVLFENLNYTTPARLLQIFGVGRHSAAIRPEEVNGLIGNPQALAERVYGLGNPRKAKELGNTRPGDGYRYRGGGALQTTGGANYKNMGDLSGVDFYNQPDLIVDPAQVLKPAIHEWDLGKLNTAADKNDIRTITRVIMAATMASTSARRGSTRSGRSPTAPQRRRIHHRPPNPTLPRAGSSRRSTILATSPT